MLGHDPIGQRGFVGTRDIIPDDSFWRELSESEASRLPYSAICQILVVSNGRTIATGTGWLAGARTVITAAHVMDLNTTFDLKVRFRSPPFDLHDVEVPIEHERFRSKDPPRAGSPHDVAALKLRAGVNRRPLEIAQPVGSQVEVAGFPSRPGAFFVTHVGALLRIERGYLSYLADSVEGHSGAPVMVQGRAVGLHVGGFSINPFPAPANTGLALSGGVLSFVNARVGEWG